MLLHIDHNNNMMMGYLELSKLCHLTHNNMLCSWGKVIFGRCSLPKEEFYIPIVPICTKHGQQPTCLCTADCCGKIGISIGEDTHRDESVHLRQTKPTIKHSLAQIIKHRHMHINQHAIWVVNHVWSSVKLNKWSPTQPQHLKWWKDLFLDKFTW